MHSRQPLSCFVIACNESDRIEDCLKSIAGWADQLIVLDSGSQDNTVEIARKYTDEVYQTDWPGYGPQRNRALTYCKHDWVLNIDADERLNPAVKAEIDSLLAQQNPNFNMVKIPWQTYLFGKPLNHGRYSTPQGKLFLKTGVQFKNSQVHETLQMPEERIHVLKSPIAHHSWRNYQHVQEKHLKYAYLLAEEKYKKGKRSSIAFACVRFFTDFIQQYIFRLGFLDGKRGFFMALILGQYAYHKYAALAAITMESKVKEDKVV
ncbi:glycosyltransferase family 2 protein [Catenovulum sediminis]|uniref:Glycosyltransferase family 2 protein n=1 Tax=Catenovulum sediminis TaxID=1740262 RepID=A0ABV1RGI2_9ALTE|nr:glycosyltransferase family 2 protein [Catenovulum sediminis]